MRLTYPKHKHDAVLVAEDLNGRYKTLIATLAQFLPIIEIELKTLEMTSQNRDIATTFTIIVSQPDDLVVGAEDEPSSKNTPLRDEELWRKEQGDEFINTVREIARLCEENAGPSRIDFTANRYVSLQRAGVVGYQCGHEGMVFAFICRAVVELKMSHLNSFKQLRKLLNHCELSHHGHIDTMQVQIQLQSRSHANILIILKS